MTQTQHMRRSKHQRGARCVYRDMTASELDRTIDTQAELLAALKLIRRMSGGLIDGEKTAAEVLAKCGAEAGAALDKAEGH